MWLLLHVTKEPGILRVMFHTEFELDTFTGMPAILSLGGEEWLNDEALRGILAFFQRIYGQGGQILFLPPLGLQFGDRWCFGKEHITRGCAKKVFMVVHMENHRGAACFDLQEYSVAFGDSLRCRAPRDELQRIVEWLKPLMGQPERWDQALNEIQQFRVPQQQDQVSCGVMASTAIERAVNQHFAWEEEVSPLSLRIRYLRLLTAYTKVSFDLLLGPR